MRRIIKYTVFLLCLCSFLCSRGSFESSFHSNQIIAAKEKKTYTYEAEKKELGSFQNITADLKEMDLEIRHSNDNKCYISYKIYCYNSHNPFTIQVKDNALLLDGRKIKAALYADRKGEKTIQKITAAKAVLLLPSKIFEKLDIKTSSGNILLQKISCETAELKTAYGDIKLSDAGINDRLAVHAAGGSVALYDTSIQNAVQIETNAGDIEARHLTAPGTAGMKTNAGNITLSDSRVSGRMKLKSVYGDVSAKKLDIRGSLYVTAQNGSISASDLSLLGIIGLKSSYGDVKMKKLRVSGGLNINVDGGDIHMQDVFVSGKAKIRNRYGNVNMQLKNACLDGLGIQAKVTDGNLSAGRRLEGRKKKLGDDGWTFEKSADGSAQMDISVKSGDIFLKADS